MTASKLLLASCVVAAAIGCLTVTTAQAPVQAPVQAPGAAPASATGIIAAQGTKFVDKNCHEYAFSGANVWLLVESQAGTAGGSPDSVREMFASAKRNGLNTIRFFPFGIFAEQFTLQTAPGQYNPKAWDALDSIIKQAADADIKLIMPFADNWMPTNGKYEYALRWGGQTDPDAFYTDDKIKTVYKNHIEAMVKHVNPLTNRAYKDEPAIFAWDLMNEMRSSCSSSAPNASCTAQATKYMQAWVEEMAAHVKSVDPNHMLTVGQEGFYASDNPKAARINPGLPFAVQSGQDFLENHRPDDIDFAATHIWVDNWQTNVTYCGQNSNPSCGPEFISAWIDAHAEDANALNKPLVVEEFGNNAYGGVNNAIRTPIYSAAYRPYEQSLKDDSINLRGVAFWQWTYSTTLDPTASDKGYAVETSDEVFPTLIAPSGRLTQELLAAKKTVLGCTPGPVKAETSNNNVQAAGRKLLAP